MTEPSTTTKQLINQTLIHISKFNDLNQDLRTDYHGMYNPSDEIEYELDPNYSPSDKVSDFSDESDWFDTSTPVENDWQDAEDYWTNNDRGISSDIQSLWKQYHQVIKLITKNLDKLSKIDSLKHYQKDFVHMEHILGSSKFIDDLSNVDLGNLQWILEVCL